MADVYRFIGTLTIANTLGEVRTAPNQRVSFIDAETGAPVTITVNGTDTDSLVTDADAHFEFTKPTIGAVRPVVDGTPVDVIIPAVDSAQRLLARVDRATVDRTALDAAIRDARQAADDARRYAGAAAQHGVLVLDGSDSTVPVYLNPSDPAALPEGSIILIDGDSVNVNPAPPVVTDPTTGGTTVRRSGLVLDSGIGAASPAQALAFEAWRGAKLDLYAIHPDASTWATILGHDYANARPAPGVRLAVRVPLIPASGSITTAATSGQTSEWAQLAGKLADGDLLIVQHAMNGGAAGSGNVTDSNINDWRTAWSKMYDAVHGRNPGVKVVWAPAVGMDHDVTNVQAAYVDGKADAIGVGKWDWWPTVTDEQSWLTVKGMDGGLDYWKAFALGKGLQLGIVEWSLHGDYPGGGDNPTFIARMLEWAKGNAAFEIYYSDPARKADLGPLGPNPNASAQYRASLGAAAPTTSGSTPTAPGTIKAQVTDTTVALSWQPATDPAATVVAYTVKRDGQVVATRVSGTTWTATGLTPDTQYVFAVAAVNDQWREGPYREVTARTSKPATTPTPTPTTGGGTLVPYAGGIFTRDISGAPKDPKSDSFVRQFQEQIKKMGLTPNLGIYSYGMADFPITPATKRQKIGWVNPHGYDWTPDELYGPGGTFSKPTDPDAEFMSVPIPDSFVPAVGTDGAALLYGTEGSFELYELWILQQDWKANPVTGWSAGQLGRVKDYRQFDGRWKERGDGVSASCISMGAMFIRPEEVRDGAIRHMLGGALTVTQGPDGMGYFPAVYGDGTGWEEPWLIPEGAIFRFPKSINFDTYPGIKTQTARMIGKAMQTYGLCIVDKTFSSIGIGCSQGAYYQATHNMRSPWDDWKLIPEIRQGETWTILEGMPWHLMEVIQLGWK